MSETLGHIYHPPKKQTKRSGKKIVLLSSGRRTLQIQVEGDFTFFCVFQCGICFVRKTPLKLGGFPDEIPFPQGASCPRPPRLAGPGPHLFHEVPERPGKSSEWPQLGIKKPTQFSRKHREILDSFPNPSVSAGDFIPSKTHPVGNPGYSLHVNTQMPWKILYRSSLAERNRICMYVCIWPNDNTLHYQPKQCTSNGKSLKFTIHLYCLMPHFNR